MKHDEKKSNEAAKFLENLMSFLTDDDLHGRDLDDDLRSRGLDPQQIVTDFEQLLKTHAPSWSEKAERERLSALETLAVAKKASKVPRTTIIEQIKELIEQMQQLGAPVVAGAYHQKFQEATDTDLESLLEDLRTQYELLRGQRDKHAK
jgi:ElaB/YqjD/DUF883 family membrane-anchored ribosome-binding protein